MSDGRAIQVQEERLTGLQAGKMGCNDLCKLPGKGVRFRARRALVSLLFFSSYLHFFFPFFRFFFRFEPA